MKNYHGIVEPVESGKILTNVNALKEKQNMTVSQDQSLAMTTNQSSGNGGERKCDWLQAAEL